VVDGIGIRAKGMSPRGIGPRESHPRSPTHGKRAPHGAASGKDVATSIVGTGQRAAENDVSLLEEAAAVHL
jgi:hypothetical protein